jgi:hypothetical protein
MGITVLDYTPQCYTTVDGDKLLQVMLAALNGTDKITVSFKGVGDVPSSFVNASFVRLLDFYSFDYIRSHVSVVDTNRQINDMISSRMRFASEHVAAA